MRFLVLTFFVLLAVSHYGAIAQENEVEEVTPEIGTEDEEVILGNGTVVKPPGPDMDKIFKIIAIIRQQLSEVLTDENVEAIMKLGKMAVKIGSILFEQIKALRNVTITTTSNKDLKYIQQQMAIINGKLDGLDRQFESVKDLIDWNTLKINMAEYDLIINSLSLKLQHYIEAPDDDVRDVYMNIFISSFQQNFNDALFKVYLAMTQKNLLFQDDLFDVARKTFHNDYRDIANLGGYLMRLLQKGMNLQIAYYTMTDKGYMVSEFQEEWSNRFEELEVLTEGVTKDVQAAWATQYKIDVDATLRHISKSTNAEVADQLYKQLTAKYPWRKLFVLVYRLINDDKERYYENCDGFERNIDGKTVIINSFPASKTAPRIKVKDMFNSIPASVGRLSAFSQPAKHVFEMVPSSCDKYTFKGVVETRAALEIRGPANRFISRFVEVHRWFNAAKLYSIVGFE